MIAAPSILAGILAMAIGDSGGPSTATDPPAQPAPAAKPCSAAAYRQFDFWLGDWNVATPDGKPAGTNRITRILGGCALREEWVGAAGTTGTSLNAFDAATRRWRQTWVDDKGGVLLLEGGFQKGRMVLAGDHPVDGRSVRERITWTPLPGGRVRQLWDSSKDGGKTWEVAFDGTYVPKLPATP